MGIHVLWVRIIVKRMSGDVVSSRKRKNEQQQRLRAKEREEKGVTRRKYVQDSTKIMILSENQLWNLVYQIDVYTNDHGLDQKWGKLLLPRIYAVFQTKRCKWIWNV
jgi:hypothetical protein